MPPRKFYNKKETTGDSSKIETQPSIVPTTTTQTSEIKPSKDQVFRNETGRPSGISLADGRTFLGLSPDDVEKIAAGEQAKLGGPATQQFEAQGQAQQQAIQQQELSQQNQALVVYLVTSSSCPLSVLML